MIGTGERTGGGPVGTVGMVLVWGIQYDDGGLWCRYTVYTVGHGWYMVWVVYTMTVVVYRWRRCMVAGIWCTV